MANSSSNVFQFTPFWSVTSIKTDLKMAMASPLRHCRRSSIYLRISLSRGWVFGSTNLWYARVEFTWAKAPCHYVVWIATIMKIRQFSIIQPKSTKKCQWKMTFCTTKRMKWLWGREPAWSHTWLTLSKDWFWAFWIQMAQNQHSAFIYC